MIASRSFSRTPASAVSATTIVSSLLTVQTAGRGFTDLTAEIAKFAKEAGAGAGGGSALGRGDAVHPPHLGIADDPGKRRSHGARRFDDGARPAGARERRMEPR